MTNAASFQSQIDVFVKRSMSPQAIAGRVAETAKAWLTDAVGTGRVVANYRRIVNGQSGATEESVTADGAIVYRFNLLPSATAFALSYAVARSPAQSGRYRKAWFVAVDGKEWTGDLAAIPSGATVTITNRQPYHRKIDVGHMKMRVPPGIVEEVRQALIRRYPGIFSVERGFVQIPGGYVLKGRAPRRAAKTNRKSSAHRAGRRHLAGRKDTARGQPMTYPAVILKSRFP